MFATLLIAIIAIAAIVYLFGAMWRLAEAIVQGIVGGVRLFWRLASATMRFTWRALRGLQRNAFLLDLCMSQHAHALWYSYSYWAQRRFIASQLRQRRKERHA